MAKTIPISLDVMGGDNGADVVIPAAEIALVRHPDIRFLLYGNEAVVLPLLEKYPRVRDASTFQHCDISVAMDAKPSQAVRHGRESSMWRAIQSVSQGELAALCGHAALFQVEN